MITNIRLGFATNSSSSHSIVILSKEDDNRFADDCDDGFNFGWENFVCSKPESKLRYFAAQMYTGLKEFGDNPFQLTDDQLKQLIHECTGLEVHLDDEDNDIWVDHQSAMIFRHWKSTETVKMDFFKDFAEWLQHKRVVIFGGNDNCTVDLTEMMRPPDSQDFELYQKTADDYSVYKLKKNGDKNYVLMNTRKGSKIRFSLSFDVPITKSFTPELVDVKITNRCYGGCEWCYQASTANGRHGGYENLKRIFESLGELNVFEVAIGGGEPTLHPEFESLLRYASHDCDLIPNFSSACDDWLANESLVKTIKECVGGIGVTVRNRYDLVKVRNVATRIIDETNRDGSIRFVRENDRQQMIMAQHVLGVIPIDETVTLIRECWEDGIPLLLLGYKTKGFGKIFKPYQMEDLGLLMNLIFKGNKKLYGYKCSMISVDTQIVNQMQPLMDQLGIHPVLYTGTEGNFSCYINGVSNTMGPSSYCDRTEMVKLSEISPEMIKTTFTSF